MHPSPSLSGRRLLLLILVGLASCAAPKRDLIFSAGGGTGLLVGSLTFDGAAGEYQVLLSHSPGFPPILLTTGDKLSLIPVALKNSALGATGDIFARDLSPGRYTLTGWRILQDVRTASSTTRSNIEFLVEPGKVTYLGNLHMSSDWKLSLHDKTERDMTVVHAVYPQLKAAAMVTAFPAGTVITGIGGENYTTHRQSPHALPVASPR
jgi:hypothetical protein